MQEVARPHAWRREPMRTAGALSFQPNVEASLKHALVAAFREARVAEEYSMSLVPYKWLTFLRCPT
jgi:hypothetical protein